MYDLISRQAAIKLLEEWAGGYSYLEVPVDSIADKLNELSAVEPRKGKGKWIDGNEGKWNAVYCPKCSVCGTPFYGIETVRYHYCPNCGAKMEEKQ